LGKAGGDYRRRMMNMIARRLPGDNPLRRSRCDDAALDALEPELFAAAKAAVYDTRHGDPDVGWPLRLYGTRSTDIGIAAGWWRSTSPAPEAVL
jgi:hypothetical protein